MLPFEECPDATKFNSIDMDDFEFDRNSATLSGTYYRCGTWNFEAELEECYESSQAISNAISDSITEMVIEFYGSLVDVDCDSDVHISCGPIPPEEVYEMFDDDEFRCCFLVDVEATCSI